MSNRCEYEAAEQAVPRFKAGDVAVTNSSCWCYPPDVEVEIHGSVVGPMRQ